MYLKCQKAKTNTILDIEDTLYKKVNGFLLHRHNLIIGVCFEQILSKPRSLLKEPFLVAILPDDLKVRFCIALQQNIPDFTLISCLYLEYLFIRQFFGYEEGVKCTNGTMKQHTFNCKILKLFPVFKADYFYQNKSHSSIPQQ